MKSSRFAALAAAALVCPGLVLVSGSPASANPAAGAPGAHNAITDVPGIQVGQVQSDIAPYLTGTSVVYMPQMSVASVDQRGGAPATKETDLLSPLNSNPGVNAIQLGGSSMYGLSATNGIIRWLEDRGEGVRVGAGGVAPIVPAADIFDLGRGGDPKARTSAEWGYLAAQATSDGPVRQGGVGGGTGARGGGLRGGVGTASVHLGDGIYVGAMVIVNPAGSPVDPADCTLYGVKYGIGDEFAGYKAPKKKECNPPSTAAQQPANTTIAVVATNAPLEKAAAQRMSGNAHDGMARAISPIHTLGDGDTVFAVSTGKGEALQINDPADTRQLNAIFNAGASTLARAIAKAVLSSESIGNSTSYCDRYPSACKGMKQLKQWRTQGNAPTVTPETFAQASQALAQTPVPAPAAADNGKPKPKPKAAPAGNTTQQDSQNGMVLASGNAGGPSVPTGVTTGLLAAGILGVGLLGMHLRGRRRGQASDRLA
ncbi:MULTISPECIES: P1 family peptidase [unclassified Micromonospora]|uniref:P1 family peptidase n=1 Tax=unclassified Micromonospora TaxID=2617518 RepID=UPI001B39BBAB|nr:MULTISPECIES: P1 family peptidase [unclassified Micromonospora]MBQ1042661.1 P1 family peptidase [Micromonospora sp. C72]MBQ1057040.1 P1 family peptidase [Micromonospora sp. C32]